MFTPFCCTIVDCLVNLVQSWKCSSSNAAEDPADTVTLWQSPELKCNNPLASQLCKLALMGSQVGGLALQGTNQLTLQLVFFSFFFFLSFPHHSLTRLCIFDCSFLNIIIGSQTSSETLVDSSNLDVLPLIQITFTLCWSSARLDLVFHSTLLRAAAYINCQLLTFFRSKLCNFIKFWCTTTKGK